MACTLFSNTTGHSNNAFGDIALHSNTVGIENNAFGDGALSSNITGSANTAIGEGAGSNITGNGNVDIGAGVAGFAGESNTTRIKNVYSTVASARAVYVSSNNKLGTVVSSQRFKEEVMPMDKASEALLSLKPVTFRFQKEIDPDNIPQFGLVAEEVEKVNPDLVTGTEKGKVYTVRYEAVNAMLLNEFLKEHQQVQDLKAIVAEQQKQIEALTAGLQKVSAQLAAASPSGGGLKASKIDRTRIRGGGRAPQMVLNNK